MPKRSLPSEDKDKLQQCLRLRTVSERGTQEIWNILRPDTKLTRHHFQDEVIDELKPWKSLLLWPEFVNLDGHMVQLPMVDLKGLVAKLLSECEDFARAIQTAQQQSPTLSAVIYFDDATAGNVLAADKSRKCALWYLTWKECNANITNPNIWLPLAAIQSDAVYNLQGGASQVLIKVLELAITQELEEGIRVETALGPMTFKQTQRCFFLGDHEAVRAAFVTKGSAGMKPCFHCSNVLKRGSDITTLDPFFVEIDAEQNFVASSNAEIFANADRLTRCATRTEREALEKATGLAYDRHGVWFSEMREKLPPSNVLTDTMHTYFSNGCASWEVALFVGQLLHFTHVALVLLRETAIAAKWKANRANKKTIGYITSLFHERLFSPDLYKGQAHQTAAIVPLLRFYLETMVIPGGRLPAKYSLSFQALSNLTRYLKRLQLCGELFTAAHASELTRLTERRHVLFKAAYGKDQFRPKHHHRFHISENLLASGFFPSCDPLEGKHQIYKGGCGHFQRGNVKKPHMFASAVLARLLQACKTNLDKFGIPWFRLLPPVVESSLDDQVSFGTIGSMSLVESSSCLASKQWYRKIYNI